MSTRTRKTNNKKTLSGEVSPARRKSGRGQEKPRQVAVTDQKEVTPDLDMQWLRETAVETEDVDNLTDKVFASVLRRCGWQRNEHGEFEHVGGRD